MSTPSLHDTVFLNATLVDGTGAAPRVADVAVRGDRVSFVGNFRGDARRRVDCRFKLLLPGFVDLHGHSDYSLLADPLAHSKVMQGVTTEVGGNCGYHAAPVFGPLKAQRTAEYAETLGLDVSWSTLDEYVQSVEQVRPAINYAQQVGYNSLRSAVTQDHDRPLSAGERDQILGLARAQLEAGCIGLSYGLAYSPACFSSTEELVDVANVAAELGKVITFHLRSEDRQLLESIDEALQIGERSGARTHIGHLKTFRRANWHKLPDALARLDRARERGLELTVDRYPHLAMNTQLKFALPTWVLEGGVGAMRERLLDRSLRPRIVAELRAAHGDEERSVLISLVSKIEHRDMEGRFLDDLAPGRDSWDVLCDLVAAEGDAVFATFFGMSAGNLDEILKLDYAIVASDASVQAIHRQAGGGRPHPRCFDTFPFFLAEWVFTRKVFPLELAVQKVTSRPAAIAGLKDRGAVAEGGFADLIVVDPKSLRAHVDYEEPIQFPSGVELVVVNGTVVVEAGRHLDRRAGRFLR